MSEHATLEQISSDHFDQIFGLNVRSPVFALQAALPLLNPGASVVLIGSIADVIGSAGYGVYSASKAALRSFARTWTRELAPWYSGKCRRARPGGHRDDGRRIGGVSSGDHQRHSIRPNGDAG
jgi:NADP-dependent 3-hydroxy acid dehydrogenase YdfG